MAFISYRSEDDIPEAQRVPDDDNILRIHRVNPHAMRAHYAFYVALMRRPGPLPRSRREMIAVVVSALNACRY